jgi:hypothetical protein
MNNEEKLLIGEKQEEEREAYQFLERNGEDQ